MKLIDYQDPSSLAFRFRRKRIRWLVELVERVIQKKRADEIKICDIGGTASYWMIFPFSKFNVRFYIDLYNLEYPGYDDNVDLSGNVVVRKLIGDACDLSQVEDKQYHIAHSNSVIEHVGNGRRVEAMAKEIRRVGEYYYVQTPNFWFPIEPHFLIPFYPIFPRPMRLWLQQRLKGKDLQAAIRLDDSVRLLTQREMKYLFPDGEILIERFMGMPKSFVARSLVSVGSCVIIFLEGAILYSVPETYFPA